MSCTKRKYAISLLALLLYLVPNLVQDVHRIWGHNDNNHVIDFHQDIQINRQSEDCAACVYEFNLADDIISYPYIPVLESVTCVLVLRHDSQIQNKTFSYYNLRAPPLT